MTHPKNTSEFSWSNQIFKFFSKHIRFVKYTTIPTTVIVKKRGKQDFEAFPTIPKENSITQQCIFANISLYFATI